MIVKEDFVKTIWKYYRTHKRDFPWRNTYDPYNILVSEIMLQQTQAPRVIPKYNTFIETFPTITSLAKAPFSKILRVWKGLGYNRRALYLKKTAEIVVKEYKGNFPRDKKILLTFPGIGNATAGDLLAFAWNIPAVVLETNIRSVFIHFFFKGKKNVKDSQIIPLIEHTLPKKNVREWYYALMDYGTYLKEKENPSRNSAHYKKQSAFKGSNREMRSNILKYILQKKSVSRSALSKGLSYPPEKIENNLEKMQKEGLIARKGRNFVLIS